MGKEEKRVAVSVIMTIHNSMPYLQEAMDTVLAQTLRHIEIICVDDGSTDGSLELLKAFATKDARVQVLEIPPTDAGTARNAGLDVATGEYLSILDSDDFFNPQMLEKSYQKAKETNADIVLFDSWIMEDGGCTLGHSYDLQYLPASEVFSPKDYADTLFFVPRGSAWNQLFRRAFINHNCIRFESIRHSDDFGFVLLAYACAERVAVLRERLVHYRFNREGSQTAEVEKYPLSDLEALMLLQKRLQERGIFDLYRVSFLNKAARAFDYSVHMFDDPDVFAQFYYAMKGICLKKFGFFEITKKESLDPRTKKIFEDVRDMMPMEFLLHRYSYHASTSWLRFSERIGKIDKPLVIYGAGDHGRTVFSQLWSMYPVATWVDRDYERIGYPVQSPKRLLDIDFSYVIITPLVKAAYKSIQRDLVAMGIPEEKILWVGDFEEESE